MSRHADDAMDRAKAGSGRASITALPGGKPVDPAPEVSNGKVRGITGGH